MICELCGKQISSGCKVNVEGSIVNACQKCSGMGKIVEEVGKTPEKPRPAVSTNRAKPPSQKKSDGAWIDDFELVDDYGVKVKNAREKKGLKQEQLAHMINEPVGSIHRMESGKFKPKINVVRQIEKKLGLKLIEETSEDEELKPAMGKEDEELTLGDMVVVREKKG